MLLVSEYKTFSDMHCTVSTYSSTARSSLELLKCENRKIESLYEFRSPSSWQSDMCVN